MVAYMLAGMAGLMRWGTVFPPSPSAATHDASIGYFNSAAIELICISFMLISAVSFSLHFVAWRESACPVTRPGSPISAAVPDGLTVITVITLWLTDTYDDVGLRHALFEVVSVATTAASPWRTFRVLAFSCVSAVCGRFVGGCSGSTAGG